MKAGFDPESSAPPSANSLRAWLASFENEGIRAATLARRTASFRLFVRFRALSDASWEKTLEELPAGHLGDRFPKALSREDAARLIDFDPGADPALIRDRALLELMYASGLRVSEAVGLRLSEIDARGGLLRIQGKGGKERIVPYHERAGEWLERYLEGVRPAWAERTPRRWADYVFLSRRHRPLTRMAAWKILRRRSLACGLDGVHPHILRHSFATHLLQGGADVRFVQALLGHASLGTTERYIKVADEELKRLFREHHPLV